MRFTHLLLFVLSVAVEASDRAGKVPYYIKMYLYKTNKQDYNSALQKIDEALVDVVRGVTIAKAKVKLRPYFDTCEELIEHWLLPVDYFLAHHLECDPSAVQDQAASFMKFLERHFALIINFIESYKDGEAFKDRWTFRYFWIQEFVDALHAAKLIGLDKKALMDGMAMFRTIMNKAVNWLKEFEIEVKKDGYLGLIRPPQLPNLKFSRYGYWNPKEIDRINSPMDKVPFDLLLKNAQYYRALNALDVKLYSYDDVKTYLITSKALINSLSTSNLHFLVDQMHGWSKQVQTMWECEKQIQLGDEYPLVKLMWSPWYGLMLPTMNALRSNQDKAGETLLDFFNFGLKGTLLNCATSTYEMSIATNAWDRYVSNMGLSIFTLQPELVPVLREIYQRYRKFFGMWMDPSIRKFMMKLQGHRPLGILDPSQQSAKWKELMLEEMQELFPNVVIHPTIVDFVRNL